MVYIILLEELAVERGVIAVNHPYPNNGLEVIFKKDVLINSGVSLIEGVDYNEMTTAQALKKYDEWQI